MKTRLKATLAAVCVALAGLLFLSVLNGGLKAAEAKPDYLKLVQQPRVELMPDESPEFLERHIPGPDGHDLRTEIEYRNGDRGVKTYRPDNSLADWDVEFAAGGTRIHALYAADGDQVVLGYEFRPDRTLKWQTTNAKGIVSTKTFYFDGKTLFSASDRKIGADLVDVRYFRKSGKPWLHQVTGRTPATSLYPRLEEVFDVDGHLVYTRVATNDSGKGAEVTYFRPDGTRSLRQVWGEHAAYGYGFGDESYTPETSSVLINAEQFGPDGTTVVKHAENTSGITTTTADDVLLKPLPSAPQPTAFWQTQEDDASTRGQDAP